MGTESMRSLGQVFLANSMDRLGGRETIRRLSVLGCLIFVWACSGRSDDGTSDITINKSKDETQRVDSEQVTVSPPVSNSASQLILELVCKPAESVRCTKDWAPFCDIRFTNKSDSTLNIMPDWVYGGLEFEIRNLDEDRIATPRSTALSHPQDAVQLEPGKSDSVKARFVKRFNLKPGNYDGIVRYYPAKALGLDGNPGWLSRIESVSSERVKFVVLPVCQ